jgi:hypothetical protein
MGKRECGSWRCHGVTPPQHAQLPGCDGSAEAPVGGELSRMSTVEVAGPRKEIRDARKGREGVSGSGGEES